MEPVSIQGKAGQRERIRRATVAGFNHEFVPPTTATDYNGKIMPPSANWRAGATFVSASINRG